MNCEDIIVDIEGRLDHRPDHASWRAGLFRRINDVYLPLMEEQPWDWMWRRLTLTVYADDTLTVSVTNGDFRITPSTAVQAAWLGQTFVGPDGAEYEITKSSTALAYFSVKPAYAGSTNAAGTGYVRYNRYTLPSDLGDMSTLLVRTQTQQPIPMLASQFEAGRPLDETVTGDPPAYCVLDKQLQDRPPLETLAGAATVGAGLTSGVTYSYFYAFYQGGRLSGRSNVVSVTPSGANLQVSLSGIETTTANSGIVKYLYRAGADGLYRYIAEIAEATVVYVDAGAVASETVLWDDQAVYRTFRTWPRPSADRALELQYHRRPQRMQRLAQVPEFPQTFHKVLVHLVCAEVLSGWGNSAEAQVQLGLAEQIKNGMRRRGLRTAATVSQRQQAFGSGSLSTWQQAVVGLKP